MTSELPEKLNVVIAVRRVDADLVRAVAPERVNVIDAFDDLFPEIEADWPPRIIEQQIGAVPPSSMTPKQRDELIRSAHVMVFGMPYPVSLSQRADNLRWIHFTNAGPVGLRTSPWWRGKATITTSRGLSNPVPIAESTLAAALMFARRLDLAAINTSRGFDVRFAPPTMLFGGKTMGIVGLGGIGSHLAKLAKGVGMKVIATRRSATERRFDADGVDELLPAADLMDMLPRCDFVALCAYWTPETEMMMKAEQFAAMKPGAYLLNIARGALTDETALIEALHSGHLGGAYLDTWWDEVEKPPRPDLVAAPNVVITPHVSGRADATWTAGGVTLLCENLRRMLNGEPLENVVDWERGY